MVFSSLEFLYLYLPVTLVLYFLSPLRWRNFILLTVSLAFYGWGEPVYVFLMIFTVAADYIFGLAVERRKKCGKTTRSTVLIAVIFNLSILGFFKYADFFILNISKLDVFSSLRPLGLSLPIGISFYTFQALSYVIDVARNDASAQKSPVAFGAYITMFPQLVAGPIVRYGDIEEQLGSRRHSLTGAISGLRTFSVGLAKKVLLGNSFGALWEYVRDASPEYRSATLAWFGIICFTFQIYFDFSGYSDMAIGLGKLLGFRFPENFNYPYASKSVTEFWRRWHITLSTWFREYVYIPLGGNRRGRFRTYINLLAVWALTGFWHGAGWNFILWGLYYFILLVIEKTFLLRLLKKLPSLISWLYTITAVIFGWLIFVFDGSTVSLDLGSWIVYLKNMFGVGGAGLLTRLDIYDILRNAPILIIAIIAATPYPKRLFYKFYEKSAAADILAALISVGCLILSTAYLVSSAYNPFLYFRF